MVSSIARVVPSISDAHFHGQTTVDYRTLACLGPPPPVSLMSRSEPGLRVEHYLL